MDKELLFLYIQGDATQLQKELIIEWLDADPAHMREFMAMRGSYDAILWRDIPAAGPEKEAKGKNRARVVAREFLKVASVFLAVFFAVRLLAPQITGGAVANQTLHVPEGQRAEITLSDNTKVWLNAKSTLVFPSSFRGGERSVELTGEAYFDVARNEKAPFIVRVRDYSVKVLGTEFDVRSYPELDLFETSLIRGAVAVASLETGQEVMLSTDMKACGGNGQLSVSELSNHNNFLWREGIISFESETFAEILSKLELYYDADIRIEDERVLGETYRYTGKFWIKDGIEHVLKVLQLDHRFRYRKEDLNNIIIY